MSEFILPKAPNYEGALLLAKDGSDCSVRMWEQDKKVTVAFNGCQAQCSGEAVDYLWPIQLERRSCF